jgi:hypothetical protein
MRHSSDICRDAGGSSIGPGRIRVETPPGRAKAYVLLYILLGYYKREITVAATKADTVFLPVLENAAKAQKLRTTLGVFERSKFFFNLPGTLVESIEAVRISLFMLLFLSYYSMLLVRRDF